MNIKLNKIFPRLFIFVLLYLSVVSFAAAQGGPEVSKVEPPSWWTGSTLNPVRVMVRGRNLTGARVEAVGAGLRTGLTRVNAAGTYLFVDVVIDPQAAPGPRRLRINTAAGAGEARFEILPSLARTGRF
ncbi:MAG TPA: cyclomaltodextrinase N-terminal domain-containing protein, partial [Pyrinomonadaceae bacterium]